MISFWYMQTRRCESKLAKGNSEEEVGSSAHTSQRVGTARNTDLL
jgi:hypothetical protein